MLQEKNRGLKVMDTSWIDEDQIVEDEEAPGPTPDVSGGWNYRLIRRKENGEESVAIHEVYYDSDGQPRGCTRDPVGFVGNDVEDLAKEVAHMEQAFGKEVLDYEEDFPEPNDTSE